MKLRLLMQRRPIYPEQKDAGSTAPKSRDPLPLLRSDVKFNVEVHKPQLVVCKMNKNPWHADPRFLRPNSRVGVVPAPQLEANRGYPRGKSNCSCHVPSMQLEQFCAAVRVVSLA